MGKCFRWDPRGSACSDADFGWRELQCSMAVPQQTRTGALPLWCDGRGRADSSHVLLRSLEERREEGEEEEEERSQEQGGSQRMLWRETCFNLVYFYFFQLFVLFVYRKGKFEGL